MKQVCVVILATMLLCSRFGQAQQTVATATNVVVPPLLNFSGVLTDGNSKPLTGTVGVTFSLYQEQQGGPPLWLETQNVKPNSTGRYTVVLGSTTSQGMPANIFAVGEARWLGVQMQGEAEQPRILLMSVPYALKAGDAETLGGKPASAFMVASGDPSFGNSSSVNTITGTGKKDYVPLWQTTTKLGSSKLFQNTAGDFGIGTTTPAANLDVNGTSDIRNTLTLFPNGGAPTLSVIGTAFSVSNTGLVSFVSGQTFPGTGTITGVAAGTDLTGGGTSGSVTLNLDTTKVPQLNAANTFTGNQMVNGNVSTTGLMTASGYQIFSQMFDYGLYARGNAFLGFAGPGYAGGAYLDNDTGVGVQALSSNTEGIDNTAVGSSALYSNTTGVYNTASGSGALNDNTTGSYNTAGGVLALSQNTTGYRNTAYGEGALSGNLTGTNDTVLGYAADVGSGNLTNATAVGANAMVGESNALVLGCINGVNNCSTSVKVGIGTATPSNIFTVGQGAGHAIADGWDTYSSRRWKANIHTLRGALEKVEHLRGVSYDLKANGKHEVGVIAEEVGAVVPEVVTWEENGEDARSVDYTRLTALLIEATKEQQRELAKALRQIRQQQKLLRAQSSALRSLEAEVREDRKTLRTVRTQVGAAQPTMVAAK
jgi:hypothetical protein